jgi:glycosyltransferase involved in cell wall biosynthesis
MNVFNPPALPASAKLPDPARAPWQPREGDPAVKELLDRIALQNQRIDILEKLLARNEVVNLEPRLPKPPVRVAAAERAHARTWQYWPDKPMPARSIEPSPGGACFHLKDAGAKVIAFAVFGLSNAELENEVARVEEQQAQKGNFIPIFLTDAQETDAFRNRGYVFEYFPSGTAPREPSHIKALQPRLDLIESKWGVDLFINLGLPRGLWIRREMRPPRERYLEAKSRFLGGRFASAQRLLADFTTDTLAQARIRHFGTRTSDPIASIIVVSHRDHAGVANGLRSIARQIASDSFEVILVDNGNTSLARLGRRYFRSCTIVEIGFNAGCSGARNIGAQIAKAPLIIFLDDDGIAEEGCVEALIRCMEETGAVAARGRVMPQTSPDLAGSHYDLGPSRLPALITCEGISIWRRATFIEAGGFDPLLAGHEGVALCSRLWRYYGPAGFIYEPGAVLLHDYAPDASASLAKSRRYKSSIGYLDFLGLRWQEINAGQLRFVTDPILGYLSMRMPKAVPKARGLSVSFITTAKDTRHFLGEYTASLKSQIEPEFEIIFVDDHSEDGTLEEIERLWCGDPRIRTFSNPEHGRGAALNEAMRHASGDICVIADVDDLSVPQRVALTRTFFAETPGADCLSFVAFSEKYPIRLGPPQSIFVDDLAVRQLFGMPVSFPTFAFRREKFPLKFDEELLGGIDCDWVYRNAEINGLKGKVVFYPAVYYREHAGQITSTRKDHQDAVRRRCITASYRRILGELSDFDVQCITRLTETKQVTAAQMTSLMAWVAAFLHRNRITGIFDPGMLDHAMVEALREIRALAPKKDRPDHHGPAQHV